MNKIIFGRVVFILISILTTYVPESFAGYLTINGDSTVTTEAKQNELIITGSYKISNLGNELAREVFPELRLGNWEWAGEAKDLQPNQSYSWSIDFTIPFNRIVAEVTSLGLSGQLPLFVRRHYQDINGMAFSAPEVIVLSYGQIAQEQASTLRIPKINTDFVCKSSNDQYDCLLSLRNLSEEAKDLRIKLFGSNELLLELSKNSILVDSGRSSNLIASVKNISALEGSTYAVFAVVEWLEKDLSRIQVVSTQIKIEGQKSYDRYILILIIIILAAVVFYSSQKVKIKTFLNKK